MNNEINEIDDYIERQLKKYSDEVGRNQLTRDMIDFANEYCRDPEYLAMTDKDELADYAFDFYWDNNVDFIEWLLGININDIYKALDLPEY